MRDYEEHFSSFFVIFTHVLNTYSRDIIVSKVCIQVLGHVPSQPWAEVSFLQVLAQLLWHVPNIGKTSSRVGIGQRTKNNSILPRGNYLESRAILLSGRLITWSVASLAIGKPPLSVKTLAVIPAPGTQPAVCLSVSTSPFHQLRPRCNIDLLLYI